MSHIISGDDALDLMNDEGNGGGNDKEFSSFKVGTKYTVKIIGPKDYFAFYSYGIFNLVNSFVAENPSKKTPKGFPVENLTPWDKAFKYHYEKSEKFGDDHSDEAYKYKPQLRYAFGFYDLDSGERIVIDVSKKQAQAFRDVIMKSEKRLGRMAFEVSKGSGGTVSLMPVFDMDEDLTDKQRENFDKAPEEFHIEDFHGVLYEASEKEQVENLVKAGFDVTKIGYDVPKAGGDDEAEALEGDDITDDDLPF